MCRLRDPRRVLSKNLGGALWSITSLPLANPRLTCQYWQMGYNCVATRRVNLHYQTYILANSPQDTLRVAVQVSSAAFAL